MKNYLFALLAVVAFCGQASAQGLFIRAGVGYNVGIDKSLIGRKIVSVTSANSNTQTNVDDVNGSYGQGVYLGARIGYMFGKYIGADVGVHYILGQVYELSLKETDVSSFKEALSNASANTWFINPAVVLCIRQDKMLSPYLRAGLAFGIPTLTITSKSSEGSLTYNKAETELRVNTDTGIGFTGTAGIDVHLGKMLGIYGEMNLLAMNVKARSAEYTKYNVNDENRMNDLPDKTIHYSDQSSQKGNNELNFAETNSFSAIGFSVGVNIRF